MKPLWEVVDAVVTPEPVIKALPYIWKHETYHPLLLQSGDLAPMDKTERRVLALENPGLDGKLIATD
ncbi:MAG: gentisate 1,2-dioxygenase, partial [Rhodospirillales bacterium]|nr:gentisate 1,2-dioxygenase [Rhodospirillales bacterium]